MRIPGVRQKHIGAVPLPPDELAYHVKMSTIPRNAHNEYGIIVIDLRLRRADELRVSREDQMKSRAERTAELERTNEGGK